MLQPGSYKHTPAKAESHSPHAAMLQGTFGGLADSGLDNNGGFQAPSARQLAGSDLLRGGYIALLVYRKAPRPASCFCEEQRCYKGDTPVRQGVQLPAGVWRVVVQAVR